MDLRLNQSMDITSKISTKSINDSLMVPDDPLNMDNLTQFDKVTKSGLMKN